MPSSDANNFSSSPPHRLPTLSASQALQNLSSTQRPISTGLRRLDAVLQGIDHDTIRQDEILGGISRGEVTEVYGPPGAGKTAFAMQTSASVLNSGGSVVWVDASYKLVGSRFREILSGFHDIQSPMATNSRSTNDSDELLENFHHFITPTLPHLLALLAHQSTSFPPTNTSLIFVDSVSTLFALAFPRTLENSDSQQTPITKNNTAQWVSGRRWAVMGDFISKISRLAATRNIAVLLSSQTTTKIRSETGAVLHPAISGTAWDSGIGSRIVLFRDWMFKPQEAASSQGEYVPGVRFAGVTKAKGVLYEGVGKVVFLRIEKDGLREMEMDQAEVRLETPPILPLTAMKRKRGEVADSESEDEEGESDQEFEWVVDDGPIETEGLLD